MCYMCRSVWPLMVKAKACMVEAADLLADSLFVNKELIPPLLDNSGCQQL